MSPDSIRDAKFRTVLRGADPAAVARLLADVAGELEDLREQRDRLQTRLGDFADRDLKTEFENVGRDVAAVLESAREAAETMRERATLDAARWRSEAMAESEQVRKDARNDAEALRGDAWTVGTEMLTQAAAEANRLAKQAERDAITITGEAEREAHRLVSTARREAEDVVRMATMDAEKMTAQASKAHDEMIEQARRQAEASQERTRALEQRREELMEELEGVRSTLSQLEGTLEAKREDLNLSRTSDTSVRIIPSSTPSPPVVDRPASWEPGETVRVVRGDDAPEPERAPAPEVEPPIKTVPSEKLAPVVEKANATESKRVGSDQVPVPPAREPAEEPVQKSTGDEVGTLFASLRDNGAGSSVDSAEKETKSPQREPEKVDEPPEPPIRSGDDLIEARDGVLLPITNRALRGIKKAITEAQNIALDGLRTNSEWEPDKTLLAETLRADLIGLWAESYAAGHDVAESMSGSRLKRPSTPSNDAPTEFGEALVTALQSELGSSKDGQRERQSAASKVFRGWRTDEAERRVHQLSLKGFHRGLVESAGDRPIEWIASGTPCSACREAASDPPSNLPPVHPGCECTVICLPG